MRIKLWFFEIESDDETAVMITIIVTVFIIAVFGALSIGGIVNGGC